MPTTSLTVDNELLSATSIEAAKEARDLRHVVTPFLAEHERVHGAGQPSKGSGHKWVGSFQTGNHSAPTRKRTGYEQMNLSFSGVLTPMVLTPAEVSYPIGISSVEEDLNGGDLQTIELASRRAKATMSKAKREFEEQMLKGGVAQYDDWKHCSRCNGWSVGSSCPSKSSKHYRWIFKSYLFCSSWCYQPVC